MTIYIERLFDRYLDVLQATFSLIISIEGGIVWSEGRLRTSGGEESLRSSLDTDLSLDLLFLPLDLVLVIVTVVGVSDISAIEVEVWRGDESGD